MFIGHFAAGLAAKRVDNRPSLGTLFLAAQFIDLLWPMLVLAGIEHVHIDPGNTAFTPLNFEYYPFSHGFVSVLIWSILFGGVYYLVKRNLKSSLVLGALVMSHWVLDLITHRPDLPLQLGTDLKVGLGLWHSFTFSLIIEMALFVGGAYLYLNVTRTKSKKGRWIVWSLLIFLFIVYTMNILGPPPPSADAVAYSALSMWLIVAWGYWADRNRSIVHSGR